MFTASIGKGPGPWGWQCFTPGCEMEREGFESLSEAESDADDYHSDIDND